MIALAELLTVAAAAEDRRDDQAAVVAGLQDPVVLAVDRAARGCPAIAAQFPAVAAGLHEVADSGGRVLPAERHAVLGDVAEPDQFRAYLRGELVGLLVGVHDQQRMPAGEGVGQPCLGGEAGGAFDRAAVDDPALLAVGLQRASRRLRAAAARRRVPTGG